jgi:hypothetical protein
MEEKAWKRKLRCSRLLEMIRIKRPGLHPGPVTSERNLLGRPMAGSDGNTSGSQCAQGTTRSVVDVDLWRGHVDACLLTASTPHTRSESSSPSFAHPPLPLHVHPGGCECGTWHHQACVWSRNPAVSPCPAAHPRCSIRPTSSACRSPLWSSPTPLMHTYGCLDM